LIIGLFLALTFGASIAIAAEIVDPSIRGSRDIQAILHTKPIVAIPVVQNSVVRAARRRHFVLVTGSLIALVAVVFSISGINRFVSLF
jgi:hypothetical protein